MENSGALEDRDLAATVSLRLEVLLRNGKS